MGGPPQKCMAKPGVITSGELVLKNGTANEAEVSTSSTVNGLAPLPANHVLRNRRSCKKRRGSLNENPPGGRICGV